MADAAALARARQSLGTSGEAIYRAVAAALASRGASGVLVDVGCGTGALRLAVGARFERYVGVDLVRYEGWPPDVELREADLDRGQLPLPDRAADAVVAAETIEHLENPRAFVRELVRILRPGGLLVVTTPNQLSALSLLTLVFRQRFSAFQDALYPAHRTALLEIDLRRIAAECGLVDVEIRYTCSGRVPLTGAYYPRALSARLPRLLSDNVVLVAEKTGSEHDS